VSGGAGLDDPLTGAVSDDAFLGGALRVLQPRAGYRAGLDAVLLAASVDAAPGQHVLDVGAGVGVVGLAVARRLPDVRVTMVERNPALAALARRNVERNGLAARVRVVAADVARPLEQAPEIASGAGTYQHVLANPPHLVEGRGTASGDPVKAAANAMPAGDLDRWCRFMAAMAAADGAAAVIHRADALPEVLAALAGRFGGTIVLPIHPRDGEPASRVLVRAVKGSRAPLELRPGLVLHGAGNGFQPLAEAILRHGAGLPLRGATAGPVEER
jgi:tRNA1(Val) A37 N6-methylase TrmN6